MIYGVSHHVCQQNIYKNTVFRSPKGVFLRSERRSIAMQKAVFQNTKDRLLENGTPSTDVQYEVFQSTKRHNAFIIRCLHQQKQKPANFSKNKPINARKSSDAKLNIKNKTAILSIIYLKSRFSYPSRMSLHVPFTTCRGRHLPKSTFHLPSLSFFKDIFDLSFTVPLPYSIFIVTIAFSPFSSISSERISYDFMPPSFS